MNTKATILLTTLLAFPTACDGGPSNAGASSDTEVARTSTSTSSPSSDDTMGAAT